VAAVHRSRVGSHVNRATWPSSSKKTIIVERKGAGPAFAYVTLPLQGWIREAAVRAEGEGVTPMKPTGGVYVAVVPLSRLCPGRAARRCAAGGAGRQRMATGG
jgi:hypothetical protein